MMTMLLCGIAASDAQKEQKAYPVGRGGRLFGNPKVETLLSRPYEDHVPMACTGECLWAGHPHGWAFADNVHYYLITPHGVGFDLQIEADGETIAPGHATFFPSHVVMQGDVNNIEVDAAKWITADDALAAHLRLRNTGSQPRNIRIRLTLPARNPECTGDRMSWSRTLHKLNLSFMAHAPGFQQEQPAASIQEIYSVEGEAYVTQRGSEGKDSKAAASGGEVLGLKFGADQGDFAEWRIDVAQPIEDAVLSIRYARGHLGDAEYAVEIGEGRAAQPFRFKHTGGWGDSTNDFALAVFSLGRIPVGPQRIRVVAAAKGCNVNFDALHIHPAGVALPKPSQETTCFSKTVTLAPQEEQSLAIFLAAGTKREKVWGSLERLVSLENPLRDQVDAYNGWLIDNVPAFTAHQAMTKQYWHRATSILRKNLFRIGEGRLTRWAIAEGRWTADWYANMISYGAGHQIREARWLRDPMYVRDIILTWCENEKADGVFPSHIQPYEIGRGQYTDWITAAAWDAYCTAPDRVWLEKAADALKHNVDGWLNVYDKDGDGLLLVDSHWWTGMEWQPSFFYWKDFDKDRQDQHLERVDLTAYVCGSARSLSRILGALGDGAGAARYEALAEKIRAAVMSTMWDDAAAFFYSVEPETHAKAMVKEVIGVYPFYFSMLSDAKYAIAWKSIVNPDEFWTPWPVASCTKQCPAYSQDITFHGKDVGGCMWNGPTWPHANSLVLSAMAATLREFREGVVRLEHLGNLLESYTMAQFRDQDLTFPWTGEYYNGETGQWRTDQRDYNHSTYLDILIADIAGIRPRPDDVLELHPLIPESIPSFLLDGVRYHGHDVTVAWNRPGSPTTAPDSLEGFRVYLNGKLILHRRTLDSGRDRFLVSLMTGKTMNQPD